MRTITCPKCKVRQDADNPICSHLNGAKGGQTTLKRYGRKHFQRVSQLGNEAKRKANQ